MRYRNTGSECLFYWFLPKSPPNVVRHDVQPAEACNVTKINYKTWKRQISTILKMHVRERNHIYNVYVL